MTHRLLSRSACRPCVQTNRSCAGRPGCPSFQAPPGKGLKSSFGVASPTDGVGTSVQRGKLPKSRPVGDTAALVIMTLPDDATDISSICSPATAPIRESACCTITQIVPRGDGHASGAEGRSSDLAPSLLGSPALTGGDMSRPIRALRRHAGRFASGPLALIALAVAATAPLAWMALGLSDMTPRHGNAGRRLASPGVANTVDQATATRVRGFLETLPLSFEPNLGQTDPEVQFLSRGRGFTLFLTSAEAVLVVHEPVSAGGAGVFRMQLVGARGQLRARGAQQLPGRSSY